MTTDARHLDEDKAQLRRRAITARAGLDLALVRAHSALIAQRVVALAEFSRAASVAAYVALPGEVDVEALCRRAFALDKQLCLPRVESRAALSLRQVDNLTSLVAGPFGLLEPSAQATVHSPAEVDLLVIPGLCFDERGGRLGFGRGYYDRLLAQARPGALLVGVCFEAQLTTVVPMDEHDVVMHHVITEQRTLRCR